MTWKYTNFIVATDEPRSGCLAYYFLFNPSKLVETKPQEIIGEIMDQVEGEPTDAAVWFGDINSFLAFIALHPQDQLQECPVGGMA